jgi:signal transduction histidine kinase
MQLVNPDLQETIQDQKVNITSLIDNVASSMGRSFDREVSVISENRNYYVSGDPEKLRQLLIILLDNAIKYSAKPITVRLKDSEGVVTIQIIDKGIGIEKSEIPHIFNRFYRVDKARTRQSGGVGLGLAIAKRIVQLHNGRIEIESEPGSGTTITVFLLEAPALI